MMAGPNARPASPRRRTPGRPRIHPPPSSNGNESGRAQKKRRYIPGGPGGGGRWIDVSAEASELGPLEAGNDINNPFDSPLEQTEATPRPRTSRTPASRPRRDRDRERTRRRPNATPRPRYSSAAAAAAASQASDGYKPREERSWEDFHPDLDIEAALMVFNADDIDGRTKDQAAVLSLTKQALLNGDRHGDTEEASMQPPHAPHDPAHTAVLHQIETPRRKPGRPPRRPESMLSGLGSPPAPRILPLPTHNPKERLNLPKPSFRTIDTFEQYEQDRAVQVNYVDKSMANVGYQEGDRFDVPKRFLIRHVEGPYDDDTESGLRLESDEKLQDPQSFAVGSVEYDMDEQDDRWLEAHNAHRKEEGVDPIKPSMFEITMTQIEREYHALEKRIPKPNPRHPQTHRPRSSSAAAVNGEPTGPGDEPDTKCVICDDGDCENANAIIFCDGCDLAVHQECYGVPFIPEGQWFCRKCKEIGRGTPTCIFCPNVDGAFKQTNTLRWSHLLCAIWIPEVSIANTTYMEPIQDVEKVPKSRWSLHCYICNQKMGACIQCGNKACYQAFHVTCARRARLFLKMKSTHTSSIDASVLKAFCDRHVPPDWRREHDVDNAVIEAKRYYRHTMRNRRWADSQTAALSLTAPQPERASEAADELGLNDDTIVVAGSKRKRSHSTKTGWRLPSGAPVVPAVVFNTVDNSLMRFSLRKRKEFLLEACKYWTLKREARKGAALLKRLQLQLESFSPMEITRRNFVGMGSAGRARLLRRIEFANLLQKDMVGLQAIIQNVRQREEFKLTDTETLKDLIDTVYFPITPLLWPILQKTQKLDEKTEMFKEGLDELHLKLSARHYTSVAAFSADLTGVLSPVIARLDGVRGESGLHDITDIHEQLNGVPPGTAQHSALSQEQKELKKLTKRIVKAAKEMLDVARRKEADLKGIPFEKEMSEWAAFDARLENSVQQRRPSALTPGDSSDKLSGNTSVSALGGASPSPRTSTELASDAKMTDVNDTTGTDSSAVVLNGNNESTNNARPQKMITDINTHPLSPPISTSSTTQQADGSVSTVASAAASNTRPSTALKKDPWTKGGVPWYLAPFDISGTTVHEERWTGMETMRAMSETLSEMDEATLQDVLEQSNGAADEEHGTPVVAERPRRNLRTQPIAEPEEMTDEEALAKERREKANAKRRAQRRRQRW